VDTPESADVLLETVALRADEGEEAARTGSQSGLGDQARGESQKLLADVSYTRHAIRHAQQMAGRTGSSFVRKTLVRVSSASKKRLVRIRMLGVVGAGGGNVPGYPIYPALLTIA